MMTPIFLPMSTGGGSSSGSGSSGPDSVLIILLIIILVIFLYLMQCVAAVANFNDSYRFDYIPEVSGRQLCINLTPGKPVYDFILDVKRKW